MAYPLMAFEVPLRAGVMLRSKNAPERFGAWILQLPDGKLPNIDRCSSQVLDQVVKLFAENKEVGSLWYTSLVRILNHASAQEDARIKSLRACRILVENTSYMQDKTIQLLYKLFPSPLNTERHALDNVSIARHMDGALYLCRNWLSQTAPVLIPREQAPAEVMHVLEQYIRKYGNAAIASYSVRTVIDYVVAARGKQAYTLFGDKRICADALAKNQDLDETWALTQIDNAAVVKALIGRTDLLDKECGKQIVERWLKNICADTFGPEKSGRLRITLTKEGNHAV